MMQKETEEEVNVEQAAGEGSASADGNVAVTLCGGVSLHNLFFHSFVYTLSSILYRAQSTFPTP